MNPSPNKYRTPLHQGQLPDGDLTPRQRTIADAVRGCRSLSDFSAAPERVVTSIRVASIPLHTDLAYATNQVARGINDARRELDRLEALFRAYGAGPFMPRAEPLHTPAASSAATRCDAVKAVLASARKQGLVLTSAGDHRLRRDKSGAYVVAP